MLDLKRIRKDPDAIRCAMKRLHAVTPLEKIIEIDVSLRQAIGSVETLKAERNVVSKEIAREKDATKRAVRIEEMREVGDKIQVLDDEIRCLEERLQSLLLQMPNVPHVSVPDGETEDDNTVLYEKGKKRSFRFEPKPHWELAENLGIIDFERGAKISGSRFYVLKGLGARLQRAIISFMLDVHVNTHRYTEVYPPYMVREECMTGTGQLPKFGANLYRDAEEDYYFIPTAEVPVTNLHSDEIFDAGDLPINYVAYSACFRREKMSAGRDVRGIKRGHQFDKVEMVKFVSEEDSYGELEILKNHAEHVCSLLNIPWRVIDICAADLSFTAAKKYDIELWAPGCNEWLEVSSCSNFEDFQARRANIRYRPTPKAKPRFVHTLNGSGLALPRTLIAILENYQNENGSVTIPDVLIPYMGGLTLIERP
jgi:seryl-tRNA synthetase